METRVRFPVAAPVVEKLFKQDPMAGICEPATWLLRSWLTAKQAWVRVPVGTGLRSMLG